MATESTTSRPTASSRQNQYALWGATMGGEPAIPTVILDHGRQDPVRRQHDGALLFCGRKRFPDLCYLVGEALPLEATHQINRDRLSDV